MQLDTSRASAWEGIWHGILKVLGPSWSGGDAIIERWQSYASLRNGYDVTVQGVDIRCFFIDMEFSAHHSTTVPKIDRQGVSAITPQLRRSGVFSGRMKSSEMG